VLLLGWITIAEVLTPLIVGFLIAELTAYLARRRHTVEDFLRRASSVDAAASAAISALRGGPPAENAARDSQWYLGETKELLGLVSLRARRAAREAQNVVERLDDAVQAVHARNHAAASEALEGARTAQSSFVRAARLPW
jgi:hypothetical protein